MRKFVKLWAVLVLATMCAAAARGQGKRMVIIDQDASGPGGTDLQSVMVLINSPDTQVLGVTVVVGDMWLDEEVAHTLRMLEIIGRTDIPVVPGAAFPLWNTKEYIQTWEKTYGKVLYQGAWNYAPHGKVHGPHEIPEMAEGKPTMNASTEDAAHFLVRLVREHPHEISIYAGGPLTNLALAMGIDPEFPSLTKELIIMGASIDPKTDDPEFSLTPTREFNFWIDPEASSMVLHGKWPRVVITTVDISVKTNMSKELIEQVKKSSAPGAQYIGKYAEEGYLWDELAAVAWLDPSIITKSRKLYMDVDTSHTAGYGNTLVWPQGSQPGMGEVQAEIQDDLDLAKFYKEYVDLLMRPTPGAKNAAGVK
jgi:purine nucleosidase